MAGEPPETVIATVDGEPVTLGQVDALAEGELRSARVEEYQVRRDALDALIARRVLADEAVRRGISEEALVASEVDAKVGEPTADEIEAVYQANAADLEGVPRSEVDPQIVTFLLDQRRAEALSALVDRLRAERGVHVLLEPPRAEVDVEGEPSRGPADARVTIVEFSDYECPYCARAELAVQALLARYPDDVRLVYRDFPLPFHERAWPAARAAACAEEQGRFWELHDALFRGDVELDTAAIVAFAPKLKLKRKTFQACLASARPDAAVARDVAAAEALGVNGTPAFFVNGILMAGALPLEAFVEVVEEELRRPR